MEIVEIISGRSVAPQDTAVRTHCGERVKDPYTTMANTTATTPAATVATVAATSPFDLLVEAAPKENVLERILAEYGSNAKVQRGLHIQNLCITERKDPRDEMSDAANTFCTLVVKENVLCMVNDDTAIIPTMKVGVGHNVIVSLIGFLASMKECDGKIISFIVDCKNAPAIRIPKLFTGGLKHGTLIKLSTML